MSANISLDALLERLRNETDNRNTLLKAETFPLFCYAETNGV